MAKASVLALAAIGVIPMSRHSVNVNWWQQKQETCYRN